MKRPLTEKQEDVLRLLAEGKNTKEIGMQMHLSPKTIEDHRTKIKRRLGIYRLALLVRYAIKHRITKLALVAAVVLGVVGFSGAPLRNTVQLTWSYPTNQLGTWLTFRVYMSADASIPATNWTVLTNVVGTNLSVTVPMAPTNMFFFLTSSNYWGESNPSQVVSTPAPPRSDSILQIQ